MRSFCNRYLENIFFQANKLLAWTGMVTIRECKPLFYICFFLHQALFSSNSTCKHASHLRICLKMVIPNLFYKAKCQGQEHLRYLHSAFMFCSRLQKRSRHCLQPAVTSESGNGRVVKTDHSMMRSPSSWDIKKTQPVGTEAGLKQKSWELHCPPSHLRGQERAKTMTNQATVGPKVINYAYFSISGPILLLLKTKVNVNTWKIRRNACYSFFLKWPSW